jgi:ABC-type branched-subunit amino acid transport system substrate-binding protein
MHEFSDGDRTKTELMTAAKKSGATVFFLYTYEPDFRAIMLAASDLGLAQTGYAFIMCDNMIEFNAAPGEEDGRDDEARAVAHGLLYITRTPIPASPAYNTFLDKWRSRYFTENGVQAPSSSDPYVAATYDAVYLFAHAAGEAVRSGVDPRDGREMMRIIRSLSFGSLGQTVQLDTNADRNSGWSVFNWLSGRDVRVADYSFESDELSFVSEDPVVWTGNTSKAPIGIDLLLGFIISRTGWSVYDTMAPAALVAVDEVSFLSLVFV